MYHPGLQAARQVLVLFSDTVLILSGASWFKTAWAHNPEKPALILFACHSPVLWVGVGRRLLIPALEGVPVLILEPEESGHELGEIGAAQSHLLAAIPRAHLTESKMVISLSFVVKNKFFFRKSMHSISKCSK